MNLGLAFGFFVEEGVVNVLYRDGEVVQVLFERGEKAVLFRLSCEELRLGAKNVPQ